jgi:uncharacterized YigZ family protein
MQDSYRTIQRSSRAELKVLGSRFIARAEPVSGKSETEAVLERLRKEHHDATHHCYAYRLGPAGDQFRANDDGEPSGSAGKPILAAIDHAELTDLVVVVIRYFGGTKLGVGGLVRAYGEAAAGALQAAEHVIRYSMETLSVDFPYGQVSNVMHVMAKTGARSRETTYDDEVHITIEIRKSKVAELKARLIEKTAGTIQIGES